MRACGWNAIEVGIHSCLKIQICNVIASISSIRMSLSAGTKVWSLNKSKQVSYSIKLKLWTISCDIWNYFKQPQHIPVLCPGPNDICSILKDMHDVIEENRQTLICFSVISTHISFFILSKISKCSAYMILLWSAVVHIYARGYDRSESERLH